MLIKLLFLVFLGFVVWKGMEGSHTISSHIQKVHQRKAYPMNISYETSAAISSLNTIRAAMGMQILTKNENLSKAAKAHAKYMVQNQLDF